MYVHTHIYMCMCIYIYTYTYTYTYKSFYNACLLKEKNMKLQQNAATHMGHVYFRVSLSMISGHNTCIIQMYYSE